MKSSQSVLILIFLFASCNMRQVVAIKDDSDIKTILAGSFTISKSQDVIPQKIIRRLNKNKNFKNYYYFTGPDGYINYGCVRDSKIPNQRLLEGGVSGDSLYYCIYEIYTSVYFGNRCLVVKNKKDKIEYWDFELSSDTKSLKGLRRYLLEKADYNP